MQADYRPERRSERSPLAGQISLSAKVADLLRPETYPEQSSRITVVDTHKSVVFLTGEHAYKLKKPIHYNSVDFTGIEARRRNCLEEVRLNRRLAPEIYLGVVTLNIDCGGCISLDGDGEIVDWLVKMRQLPADRMLDYLLRHDRLVEAQVRAVTRFLARFYRDAPPAGINGRHYLSQLEREIQLSFQVLASRSRMLPVDRIETVHDWLRTFLRNEAGLLDERVSDGRVVEGHGDLRPAHICVLEPPVIFDCLEFDRRLRIVDAVDEIAFLAMECESAGAEWVNSILFDTYSQVTDDRPPRSLIAFYKAYRAFMWARLAIWRVKEIDEPTERATWIDRANGYLRIAEHYSRSSPIEDGDYERSTNSTCRCR